MKSGPRFLASAISSSSNLWEANTQETIRFRECVKASCLCVSVLLRFFVVNLMKQNT